MSENNISYYTNLTEDETAFLRTIEQQMGIVADLSRADLLLYVRTSFREATVIAHARPHSLAHVHNKNIKGKLIHIGEQPELWQALIYGKHKTDKNSYIDEGAPVTREVMPIYFPSLIQESNRMQQKPSVIAALSIVTNLIEYERNKLRNKTFRRVLKKLQLMVLYGQMKNAASLSSFGEQDGIIFIDKKGVITYASGVAANLYRKLGYKGSIIGQKLETLETSDEKLRQMALSQNRCLEQETEEGDRIWISKAIPISSYPTTNRLWLRNLGFMSGWGKQYGVIMTLHDATEIRRQSREMQIKNAMIQEIHHRVKNNLQTIAGLLRMQIRRIKSEEARLVLDETLHRILSIAVIHEFLSRESSTIINIKDVSNRIASQLRQGILTPDKEIGFEISGEPIYLPPRQATACSLVINELLQNAIEHGLENRQNGLIQINFKDNGDNVIIQVSDNGAGLPADFQIEQADSLGLYIVKILVEEDLNGEIKLTDRVDNSNGLSVLVEFPKILFGGEEGWKEHVSL